MFTSFPEFAGARISYMRTKREKSGHLLANL